MVTGLFPSQNRNLARSECWPQSRVQFTDGGEAHDPWYDYHALARQRAGMKRGELERAAAAAALRALAEAPGRGSVLVFLPGGGEVSPALNPLSLMLSVIRACSQRQWHVLAHAGPFYERAAASCPPACLYLLLGGHSQAYCGGRARIPIRAALYARRHREASSENLCPSSWGCASKHHTHRVFACAPNPDAVL